MQKISIWGEGVAGSVRLKIKSISATGCAAAQSAGLLGASNTFQEASASSFSFLLIAMAAAVAAVAGVVAMKRRRPQYDRVLEITSSKTMIV
jgi:hypothetical protein